MLRKLIPSGTNLSLQNLALGDTKENKCFTILLKIIGLL